MNPDLEKLKVSRSSHPLHAAPPSTRRVRVRDVVVGDGSPVVIAGPCTVESREQTVGIARAVKAAGARMLRGGAFKPRTSPYSFQGMGKEGLEILAEARAETGLPVVTEVLDPRLVGLVGSYADVIQIGSRSMQNFPLLTEVGRLGKPVLLKRGFGATVEEWVYAAEYVALGGCLDILMCERGIRSFTNGAYDRATLDLAAVHAVRQLVPFPVVVDPTHAAGRAALVPDLAFAALGLGVDALLIEAVLPGTDPKKVLCDGEQGITPDVLRSIVERARATAPLETAAR
ncbi:3-deoxy-7-phosphoheptulonate synthase [Acidobacteria bacterium ACD]|nr:MAG: 3-deoxy-7-phosphoheptulonate synthase [Acidobacteriota bacterium]MDL1949447.1 3-deoxy-7-phosphoheptulonate synthase [Acidobacteria bacterium ACD]